MEVTYLTRDQFIEVAPSPPEASIFYNLPPEWYAFARELARLEAARLLRVMARRGQLK